MAQDEQTAESFDNPNAVELPPLHDFLYRDTSRIASYTAQLFGGLLTSLEETKQRSRSDSKQTKIGFPPAQHQENAGGEAIEAARHQMDPHDVIATDILSHLVESNRVRTNIDTAPHGSLVLVNGTLAFVDRNLLECGTKAISALVQGIGDTGGMTPEELQQISVLGAMLTGFDIPSSFVLRSDGVSVVGTIKEQGMEEPISTYYFRHGASGLDDVYLIGIKEVSAPVELLPHTQLIGSSRQMTQALYELLFPPDAVRVTPIAIFRLL